MYCKHCGEQIEENSTFCKKCGGKQNEATANEAAIPYEAKPVDTVDTPAKPTKKAIHCPKCGATGLVTNETRSFWVCNNCGHKFRQVSDLEKEIYVDLPAKRKLANAGLVVSVIMIALHLLILISILMVVGATITYEGNTYAFVGFRWTIWIYVTTFICSIITAIVSKLSRDKFDYEIYARSEELKKLKRDMGYED